jgi:hypothetical protein
VTVEFWIGKPVSVQIHAERGIVPQKLKTYVDALQRAAEIVAALQNGADAPEPE